VDRIAELCVLQAHLVALRRQFPKLMSNAKQYAASQFNVMTFGDSGIDRNRHHRHRLGRTRVQRGQATRTIRQA
jgi:hypothetical protein